MQAALLFLMNYACLKRVLSWRRAQQPTPVFLPGESHGQRSPVGYSPRGHKESDTTERLHFHFYFYFGLMTIFLHIEGKWVYIWWFPT